MHTRISALLLVLCLAFAMNTYAYAQESAVPEPEQSAVRQPVASDDNTGSFFSWQWLIICVIAAGGAFVLGKISGKQDNDFTAILLDNLVSSLPDVLEIEYEVEKITSSRVKLTVRVLAKQQDGIGKLTATEQELHWHDLPDEIRADFIRSGNTKHIRSLHKGNTDKKEK